MESTASLALMGSREVTKPSMAPLFQLWCMRNPIVGDVVGAGGVGFVVSRWKGSSTPVGALVVLPG